MTATVWRQSKDVCVCVCVSRQSVGGLAEGTSLQAAGVCLNNCAHASVCVCVCAYMLCSEHTCHTLRCVFVAQVSSRVLPLPRALPRLPWVILPETLKRTWKLTSQQGGEGGTRREACLGGAAEEKQRRPSLPSALHACVRVWTARWLHPPSISRCLQPCFPFFFHPPWRLYHAN